MALGSLIVLAGCHQGGTRGDQVVARGKGFEVVLPELEQILRQAPPVSKDQIVPARRSLLDALIDQKLLAQAAAETKLDQRPSVVQSIEAARRAVLAQVYAEQVSSSVTRPSDNEVAGYYANHPQLFAQRMQLVIDDVILAAPPASLSRYRQALENGGPDAVQNAVKGDKIPVQRRRMTISTDDLAQAGRVPALAVGDTVSFASGGLTHMGKVLSVDAAPLTLEEARPVIVQRLEQERRSRIVQAEVARLRRLHDVTIDQAKLKGTTNL